MERPIWSNLNWSILRGKLKWLKVAYGEIDRQCWNVKIIIAKTNPCYKLFESRQMKRNQGMWVNRCVRYQLAVGPMTSSAVCFEKQHHMKHGRAMQMVVKVAMRGGKFSVPMFVLRGKTMLAVAVGINSYLCQVGIDPFCKCPLLHCLLLICKLEPSVITVTHMKEQTRGNLSRMASLFIVVRVDSESWILTIIPFCWFLFIMYEQSLQIRAHGDKITQDIWHLKMAFSFSFSVSR